MKGAVILQFLVTVPTDGVAHTFHFNLRLESQSLPIRSPGQDELRLPDFPGERIAGIERAADRDFAIVTREGHTQHPGTPVIPSLAKPITSPGEPSFSYSHTNDGLTRYPIRRPISSIDWGYWR